MTDYLTMAQSKRRLAALWFTFGGGILLLIFLQSLFGRYGPLTQAVWQWVLPTVMPTLSLILGVLLTDLKGEKAASAVDGFTFWLSFLLSAVYLLAVLTTILIQDSVERSALKIMEQSNLFLGPMQGLVAAAIGAFFVKSETGKSPKPSNADG